jgi:signal transduction histidine kinase
MQLKTRPFRLLLYLEWILLGMVIVGELPWEGITYLGAMLGETPQRQHLVPYSWQITIICLVGFGLMGLRLPTGQTINKWLYTGLGLGLILLADAVGGWGRFGVPYIIILIRGCQIFQMPGRLLVAGLVFFTTVTSLVISFGDLQALQAEMTRPVPTIGQIKNWVIFVTVNTTFYYGLLLAFILMLVNALLSERHSRQQLAIAHEQLRQYALRIEDQATLQERNRIAREIHDSLGHALTAQSIQLENALLFCPASAEKTKRFLHEAKQLGAKALKEVRQSISTLRADPLQGRSLEEAIATLIQDFYRIAKIQPDSTIYLTYPISGEISIAIYRIVQEALTNVSKHSGATQVTILLQTKTRLLHLAIDDNGRGFNPKQNTTGFGLQGMRERTTALGGQIQIKSQPGCGCQVIADIPLSVTSYQ